MSLFIVYRGNVDIELNDGSFITVDQPIHVTNSQSEAEDFCTRLNDGDMRTPHWYRFIGVDNDE